MKKEHLQQDQPQALHTNSHLLLGLVVPPVLTAPTSPPLETSPSNETKLVKIDKHTHEAMEKSQKVYPSLASFWKHTIKTEHNALLKMKNNLPCFSQEF